ncbi:hypothetical protein C4D60_Mb01t07610 [Musa balbisiana]|uniref:Uncharacterized protein n=1 Tax=Musa balbisiana TaxID=52838 RepID=A0A4S8JKK9_MUSBA|nr:hypothetical protein C4D60_Mb01t07610 [Musa balbisiana]
MALSTPLVEQKKDSTCNSLYKGLLLTEAFSSHDGVHSDTSLPASSTFVFATRKLGVSSSFWLTIFRSDKPNGEEGNTNLTDPRSETTELPSCTLLTNLLYSSNPNSSSAPSLSSEPWLPGGRTNASSLFPLRHGVKVAAFFPLRNRATRFSISEPSSRFRYDSESRDLLGSTDPRPKALRMRWGAWTGRGRGAAGGNWRRAAAGVAATGAGGVRGRKSAGGDGILAFLEGGEGPAATSKTGCEEKGRRRSTARRRLRFFVRAPMATRSWTEKETVEASVPWTGLGFHWREREREKERGRRTLVRLGPNACIQSVPDCSYPPTCPEPATYPIRKLTLTPNSDCYAAYHDRRNLSNYARDGIGRLIIIDVTVNIIQSSSLSISSNRIAPRIAP